MKNRNYVITYVSALVIGILLLIYHQRFELYKTIVEVIGALIALPSLIVLLTLLFRKKKEGESGGAGALAVASGIASGVCLAFGIWMIASPQFFITAIIYTLGAILIIVAAAQMINVYQAARPFRPAVGWFIVPVLTLLAGVIIIVLGPDKVSAFAGLVTGIVLIVYAANGFASAGREAKLRSDMQDMEKEKLREEAEDRRRIDSADSPASDPESGAPQSTESSTRAASEPSDDK